MSIVFKQIFTCVFPIKVINNLKHFMYKINKSSSFTNIWIKAYMLLLVLSVLKQTKRISWAYTNTYKHKQL